MRILLFFIPLVLAGACASTGATPKPFPTPNPPGAAAASAGSRPLASPATGSPIAYSVTGTALSLRGAPYKNGGSDPSGFDCSGFVRYVFSQHGVTVPRTVTEQFRAGKQLTGVQVEPGDLVFFSTVAPGASHVGIAIGGDEFIHAPSGAGDVRVERMSAPYWATRFVGARRVL
jgi:cell wall-associated NlpC family hydrolase